MALRQKTIEVPFPTETSALAAATRRELAAVTVYIPETNTRSFVSVTLRAYYRGNETAAASQTSALLGIKLGAAAFSDVTQTVTATNTGDQQAFILTRDVTAYFTTNFGAGTSQTCQAAVQLGALATIGHSLKLVITYNYEDAPSGVPIATRVKTVRFPLDSNTAQLTATLANVGATSNVPALDTICPEASKVYRHIWFESYANDGGNATTDVQLFLRLDAEAEVARTLLEQALNTGVWFEDFWVRNDLNPAVTHTLQARSSLASRFTLHTVVLCVTYEYNHSTSTSVLNSLLLPAADESAMPGVSARPSRFERVVWIEEPGPIAMVQSGVVAFINDPGTVTLSMRAGAQSFRTFTLTAGSTEAGPRCAGMRIDSGGVAGVAAVTLARGRNDINIDWYVSAAAVGSNFSAWLYLNYTSGIATAGDGAHAHSVCYQLIENNNANNILVREVTAPLRVPAIPETSFFLTGLAFEVLGWAIGAAVSQLVLQAERLTAEPPSEGWEDLVIAMVRSDGELSVVRTVGAARDSFRRWPGDVSSRLDLEVSRAYRLHSSTAVNASVLAWVTYSAITFSKVITVSGSAGGTVTVNVRRLDGTLLWTGTRAGDGTVSATLYDDTESKFTEARETDVLVGRSGNWT